VSALLRATSANLRIALMLALQYRASFVAEAVMAFAWIAWTIVPLLVVFQFREGIAGWTQDEALLVIGFFTVLEGITSAFVDPNLRAVVEQVRDGTLDFTLLKPVDTQLLVSVHRIQPTELPHLLAGLLLVGVAASRLPRAPAALEVAQAAALLLAGTAILHALWTIIVSTSFWFVKVDNLSVLLRTTMDTGRWPMSFFPTAVRLVLTFLLPVGLMTTYPALALRGLLEPGSLAVAAGVAVGFVIGARLVWRWAIGHYTSASS
jgi:ABC-2 type transport system permease protein